MTPDGSGSRCFFASDLHGRPDRYHKLFDAIERERPAAVFLGGDLLPHHWALRDKEGDFIGAVLAAGIRGLQKTLGENHPEILLILGNDDDRASEEQILRGHREGLWTYLHERWASVAGRPVLGYSCVPPTPFQLKDWERYDVSRYTDPGCVSPEAGQRTVAADADDIRYGTIATDLLRLIDGRDLTDAVILFHTPPYQTSLDRAALDGQMVDHAPLDVHVGSIAVKRLIEDSQPLLTLHGHIHESAAITGTWRERLGRTHAFSAAHDGPELALIRFDLDDLEHATRELI